MTEARIIFLVLFYLSVGVMISSLVAKNKVKPILQAKDYIEIGVIGLFWFPFFFFYSLLIIGMAIKSITK